MSNHVPCVFVSFHRALSLVFPKDSKSLKYRLESFIPCVDWRDFMFLSCGDPRTSRYGRVQPFFRSDISQYSLLEPRLVYI